VTVRKDAVLDWLLEASDPGVRFFALRDLLGAPPDDKDLLAARRATVRRSPVRDILGAQDRDGFWVKPGPGYSPKYTGTSWQIIFLGQFGADGENRRVRRGADYVLDHSRAASPYHGFSATGRPDGLVHCLQGNLGAALLELGYGEDPRLRLALDWLARSITGDGLSPGGERPPSRRKCAPDPSRSMGKADARRSCHGLGIRRSAPPDSGDGPRYYRSGTSAPGFCCSANNHKPCAWGAIPALDALSRIPPSDRTPPQHRAIRVGLAFLLGVDPAQAAYPMGFATKPNGSWFKFGYPLGYVTDVLRNAEVLVALGKGKDRRLRRLRDLILSKRAPDGRWRLEYSYAGKTWFDLGAKGAPSKWVTLRARRALMGLGGDA